MADGSGQYRFVAVVAYASVSPEELQLEMTQRTRTHRRRGKIAMMRREQ